VVQGRVKWYSVDPGYGLILPDDGGVQLLVRHDDIVDDGLGSLENNGEP
jgi:cold shock CspA family protein